MKILQNDNIHHNRLKEFRKRVGITQAELAERIHYSQPLISGIESGSRDLSEDIANTIAEAFKTERVQARWLLGITPFFSAEEEQSIRKIKNNQENRGAALLLLEHLGFSFEPYKGDDPLSYNETTGEVDSYQFFSIMREGYHLGYCSPNELFSSYWEIVQFALFKVHQMLQIPRNPDLIYYPIEGKEQEVK